MRIEDFQIDNFDKLDKILIELCQLIHVGQKENPEYNGLVAACVLDNDNNIVQSTSYEQDGKYVHAERAAINKYIKEIGPLEGGSIIVTTLSPCSKEMGDRYSKSCTDLINSTPIKKVYCGYSDPTQDDSNDYLHKTFHVKVTRNKEIQSICKSFADKFLKKGLFEVNPDTVQGSEGPGLNENREYLIEKLKEIKQNFNTIYILGSWYGNLSILIDKDTDIGYDKIINVENDKEKVETSEKIIKNLGHEYIDFMYKDANDLDYRQLGKNGLVINTSCNNIQGSRWFDRIPEGTMVVLSARNNDSKAPQQFESVYELAEAYPLSTILYAGKREFRDPETEYDYYLLIGKK